MKKVHFGNIVKLWTSCGLTGMRPVIVTGDTKDTTCKCCKKTAAYKHYKKSKAKI